MRLCAIYTTMAFLIGVFSFGTAASGQGCEADWSAEAFELSGLNGIVYCAVEFDDGRGPALYVGGSFSIAGGTVVSNIARWDGLRWEAIGDAGPDSTVYALAVHNDGSGDALYVGGRFRSIEGVSYTGFAKWDGQAWSRPPGSLTNCTSATCVPTVTAMAVFDEGDGTALYVGGNFQRVPALGFSRVFRYVDGAWALPLAGPLSAGDIEAMAVHDDGQRPVLYIGGRDSSGGGSPLNPLHALSADGFSIVPSVTDSVWALATGDVGDGRRLFAATDALDPTGEPIDLLAAWDGRAWSRPGPILGPAGNISSVAVHDSGSGPKLFVGGGSIYLPGQSLPESLLRLEGDQWIDAFDLDGYRDYDIEALLPWVDDTGPVLVVGGNFAPPGLEPWEHLLRIGQDGIARQFHPGMPGAVKRIAASPAEGVLYLVLARPERSSWDTLDLYSWDGRALAYVTGPFDAPVNDLLMVQEAAGPVLYAAGDFTSVAGQSIVGLAKWDGVSWQGFGLGEREFVEGIEWLDAGDGPALYAYGDFRTIAGTPARGIARYAEQTWAAMGDGLPSVYALEVFDRGQGPVLYAGGGFDSPTGKHGGGMAWWTGQAWADEGVHRNGGVFDLEVFDDGTGPGLYATGWFTDSDTTPSASRIARWDGTQWSSLGQGISGGPGGAIPTGHTMRVFDDGAGEKLYVGGHFLSIGGVGPYIGAWDGRQWHDMGAADDSVWELEVLAGPRGGTLYAMGAFDFIDERTVSVTLAERRACESCPADLDGDGALTLFDFLAFQNLFDSGDPIADFDGDGALTIFDFLAFQNAFDAGCG